VLDPAILLADEPTGNLDRAAGADVVRLLEGLNADGLTLIVVTHDPEIGRRARRAVRLVDGVIDQDRVREDRPEDGR
jgi:putative ABC transport system ATP-binding protein